MELFKCHEELKNSRSDTRAQESELARVRETYDKEVATNARLEKDVEAIFKRKEHLANVKLLEMKKPWIVSLLHSLVTV